MPLAYEEITAEAMQLPRGRADLADRLWISVDGPRLSHQLGGPKSSGALRSSLRAKSRPFPSSRCQLSRVRSCGNAPP